MKTNRNPIRNMIRKWIEAMRQIAEEVNAVPAETREIFNLATLDF